MFYLNLVLFVLKNFISCPFSLMMQRQSLTKKSARSSKSVNAWRPRWSAPRRRVSWLPNVRSVFGYVWLQISGKFYSSFDNLLFVVVLKQLLRRKAADEVKRQQEMKEKERQRVISERTGTPKSVNDAYEGRRKFFIIFLIS